MNVTTAMRSSGDTTLSYGAADLDGRVRDYWNVQLHDANVSQSPPGSQQFFGDLEAYRYHKLDYLPRVMDFAAYAGRDVLEIGCGIGLDLARFAGAGGRAVGVDVSATAIGLARRRLEYDDASATLLVANGAKLPFPDESFDLVYCHGVLPYVADPEAIIQESYRVLRTGGEAVFMAYHRRSWLNVLSRLGGVRLAHADAPVLRTTTRDGMRNSLRTFQSCRIMTERFPVPTRMHGGWKATAFNNVLVPLWRLIPEAMVRPFGWHLLAFCRRLA